MLFGFANISLEIEIAVGRSFVQHFLLVNQVFIFYYQPKLTNLLLRQYQYIWVPMIISFRILTNKNGRRKAKNRKRLENQTFLTYLGTKIFWNPFNKMAWSPNWFVENCILNKDCCEITVLASHEGKMSSIQFYSRNF